jgi:hypothetical protein
MQLAGHNQTIAAVVARADQDHYPTSGQPLPGRLFQYF